MGTNQHTVIVIGDRQDDELVLVDRLVHGSGDGTDKIGTLLQRRRVRHRRDLHLLTVPEADGDPFAVELSGKFIDHGDR